MTEEGTMPHGCASDADFVFGKNYTCPVCGKEFKNLTVKSSKVRMIRSDQDLRPIYENVNPLKYDIVFCSKCGYGALERYFKTLSSAQKTLIKEKICIPYKEKEKREEKATFSYEDAYYRYRMALACSVAKQAYDSERAYVCLKTAWLLRGWRESLPDRAEAAAAAAKLEKMELEMLKNAKEGFQQANVKEDYPLCGMDESTVDYLVAALCLKFGELDTAMKLVSTIIANRAAGQRVKDRARDLKDEILQKSKEQGQA